MCKTQLVELFPNVYLSDITETINITNITNNQKLSLILNFTAPCDKNSIDFNRKNILDQLDMVL